MMRKVLYPNLDDPDHLCDVFDADRITRDGDLYLVAQGVSRSDAEQAWLNYERGGTCARCNAMLIIQRISDGAYIRRYEDLPDGLHVVLTDDITKALPMSEAMIGRFTDMNAFGNHTLVPVYRAVERKEENDGQ